MSLLPRSPRIFAATVAALGIGLLLSLPLVAQPIEQSPVDISRSSMVPEPNPPHIDFNNGIVNVKLTIPMAARTRLTLVASWRRNGAH